GIPPRSSTKPARRDRNACNPIRQDLTHAQRIRGPEVPNGGCARGVDMSALPPLSRAVAERVVHASADLRPRVRGRPRTRRGRPARGLAALRRRAGRRRYPPRRGRRHGAAGVLWAGQCGPQRRAGRGGCIPTALAALLGSTPAPMLMIGLPACINCGPKGAVAAAMNALRHREGE
ncbi:MAG: hypothetical protein ACRD0K_04040, partial [Egibacteraceae bacterium]